jgi:general secretion pathway protein E
MVAEQVQAEIYPLPTKIVGNVAFDRANKTVYVDRRFAGEPLLLTWQDRNKAVGHVFHIKPVALDELAKLRAGGLRIVENIDQDQLVRVDGMDILKTASKYQASDIHFMCRVEHTEIQVVVKGKLRTLMLRSQAEGEALIRAFYQGIATVRDASFNPLEFQNAQISLESLPPGSGLTSVRIIRGPCFPQSQGGAFMTLRLQYRSSFSPVHDKDLKPLRFPNRPDGEFNLGSKGFTQSQIEKIQQLIDSPNGIIIVTGPTGSGKSTTQYEILKERARQKPYSRLVTIEDPVEYPMDFAVQLEVTGTKSEAETGAAFGERLRAGLRMAPNGIQVGELRGADVAVTAFEAAVTGHQVWTTMHVSDPYLFVERLELMDETRLNRRVFCDPKIVRGVIAQRLLPKLCECATSLSGSEGNVSNRLISALRTWGDISRVRLQGDGCELCNHDGTLGRFAVGEVVVTDATLMDNFISKGTAFARDHHRKQEGADPSMLERGIKYALEGLVDPRTVEEQIDLIEPRIQ